MEPRSVTARERGLALISRVNRWLIAGAVGLSGLISLAAAHAFHGRTLSGGGSPLAASPTLPQSQTPAGDDGGGGGLQQPAQAPAPAAAAPSAGVSGGS